MKRGMVAPTPHITTLWHQRPRCDGARQRRLLCVATATPQSRHGGARGQRLLRAAPRHPSVGSRFSLKQRPCFLFGGMTSVQGFLSTWSLEPTAIPEEVGRVVLPSPAPEIHLSVARCCCRQGPPQGAGAPDASTKGKPANDRTPSCFAPVLLLRKGVWLPSADDGGVRGATPIQSQRICLMLPKHVIALRQGVAPRAPEVMLDDAVQAHLERLRLRRL